MGKSSQQRVTAALASVADTVSGAGAVGTLTGPAAVGTRPATAVAHTRTGVTTVEARTDTGTAGTKTDTGTAGTLPGGVALPDGMALSARAAQPDTGLPVLPALHGLLSGLRRGHVTEVDAAGALPLALVAGATQAGSWCGIVGIPECGVVAAGELGCDLDRLILVDEPGGRWADVTATLVEAVDVVLLRPPVRPPTALTRRLVALARKSDTALVVIGAWESPSLRLRVESSLWLGVENGHGHLRSRRVKVAAQGRLTGGRPRSAWLWLPGPDGTVSNAELTSVTNLEPQPAAAQAGNPASATKTGKAASTTGTSSAEVA